MKTKKMMKRFVTLMVILCLAFTALTSGAFADNTRKVDTAAVCDKGLDFQKVYNASLTVDNESDSDLTGFYLVLASDTTWGNNLLGEDTIPVGIKGTLYAHVRYAPDTLFQVRVVTASGADFWTDPFDFSGLNNPEAITIVVRGDVNGYMVSVRY